MNNPNSQQSPPVHVHYVYDGSPSSKPPPKNITQVSFTPSVTEIADYAFKDCTNLTSIIIPQPMISIGNYAFYNCTNLTSIILPPTLKEIGNAAFDGCTSLTSITIPPSITKIRYRTFYRCSNLIAVFFPKETLRDIRNNAFADCESLCIVKIPKSVKHVLYSAFDHCETLKLALVDSSTDENDGDNDDDDFDNQLAGMDSGIGLRHVLEANSNSVNDNNNDTQTTSTSANNNSNNNNSNTSTYVPMSGPISHRGEDDVESWLSSIMATNNTGLTSRAIAAAAANSRQNNNRTNQRRSTNTTTTTTTTKTSEENLESWLHSRFDHLPIHECCYYFAAGSKVATLKSTTSTIDIKEQQHNHASKFDDDDDDNDDDDDDNNEEENVNNDNDNDKSSSSSSSTTKMKTEIISLIQSIPETISITDELGMTPLHILSSYCHIHNDDIIILHIAQLMNELMNACHELPFMENRNGMTPLDLYIKCCCGNYFLDDHDDDKKTNDLDRVHKGTGEDGNNIHDMNIHFLPLCILIKLGMKWNQIEKIIAISPNMALERGVNSIRISRKIKMDDDHDCVLGQGHCEESELYPFMEAAVVGDLETVYNLALYRVDLLQ